MPLICRLTRKWRAAFLRKFSVKKPLLERLLTGKSMLSLSRSTETELDSTESQLARSIRFHEKILRFRSSEKLSLIAEFLSFRSEEHTSELQSRGHLV